MESVFEQNGGTYIECGDYQLPNLSLSEEKEYHIGVWGQRYRKHLKSAHRVLYYNYLTKGTLYEHLTNVDTQAEEMFSRLVKSLAEKENITEKMKLTNPMEWVQRMNNIRFRAMETVNAEVIFI